MAPEVWQILLFTYNPKKSKKEEEEEEEEVSALST